VKHSSWLSSLLFPAVISLAVVSLAIIAQAKTIHVPVDQPTIQAGINAANNGDTVLVAPGTYFENINFMGKAITVKSSRGRKVTTIDGGNVASVVTFSTGEGLSSVLRGFTIQHGNAVSNDYDDGGGIFINNASPTITGNTVTDNVAGHGGGGIAVLNYSTAVVQGNIISNNSYSSFGYDTMGGAILINGGGGATQIIGNVIENNSWNSRTGGTGAIALDEAGTPTIENNIIRGNTVADGSSTAISISDYSDALIVQNLIYNNTAPYGAPAIFFMVPEGRRGPLFVNNTIVAAGRYSGNSAVYADGFYDQVQFYNNLLIGASGAPAVYCNAYSDPIPPTLTNNDGYSPGAPGFWGACSGQSGTNGNISADPLFVGKTNFRLRAKSPAINAGDNSAPDIPPEDLAGKPRIVDGAIDMGAYEYPD